jgi:hypothetical protein
MIANLPTDHIAGAVAILAGAGILLISGDLPMGTVSFPGAGMLPKLLCGCLIVLGIAVLFTARQSPPVANAGWSDLRHAVPVFAIAAIAIALHSTLGFIISMALMLFGLVMLERRAFLPAVIYGVGVSLASYTLFAYFLRAPLARGLFGF